MVVARPRLIGLLAAHFATFDSSRLDRLRRLLRSVQEQTCKSPLLLSWSVEDPPSDGSAFKEGMAAEAKAVIQEFETKGVVHSLPQLRGRRSQFQHYARLRETLKRHVSSDDEPWVFFSDDDDVWHPRRTEEYLAAIESRPKAEEVVHSRIHLTPGLAPRLAPTATTEEISRMESEGQLRVAISADKDDNTLFGTATGEYFDAAAKFCVFDEFFNRHNNAVTSNRFADIRFRAHMLRWHSGVHRFLPRGARGSEGGLPWMYLYDRPTQPYNTPAGQEDLQYVCEELPDPKRIAGLRQTLDCVLFQLAPTQGPLRISEQQFAESLVGMLADINPATVSMAMDRCRKHGVEVVRQEKP